jgi:hypothetical protein
MTRLPSVTGVDSRLLMTLTALGDYLRDVVVVGGWVPHLYRKTWPSKSPVEARRTLDLDAAVRGRLPTRHRERLDVLLEADGYAPELGGTSGLPAQIYHSPPHSDLLPIEFLAPLVGRSQETSVEIQEGVTAQALRYLNILLENSFDVRLSTEGVAGSADELTVRIPIPGAYVFHRGLISTPRGRRRRGKDLYYIFETWVSLPDQHERIAREVRGMRDRYSPSWYRRFRSNLESLFPTVGGAGVLLVFQQYEAREPTGIAHQRIYQAFRDLLTAVPRT